jgi:hypothetical protein
MVNKMSSGGGGAHRNEPMVATPILLGDLGMAGEFDLPQNEANNGSHAD